MTREEAECRILKKMREIAKIYKEYNTNPELLCISLSFKHNICSANNEYWKSGHDENKPINVCEQIFEEDKK